MNPETYASIALIWATAVMIPGPDLLAILQSSMSGERKHALLTVIGIAAGTICWGLIALVGVTAAFQAIPALFVFLKFVGGLYLIYVGIGLLRTKAETAQKATLKGASNPSHTHAFARGFAVNMSNPKTALLISSFIAATLDRSQATASGLMLIMMLSTISLVIYALFAFGMSSGSFARFRQKATVPISRLAGLFFLAFGLKFILDDKII